MNMKRRSTSKRGKRIHENLLLWRLLATDALQLRPVYCTESSLLSRAIVTVRRASFGGSAGWCGRWNRRLVHSLFMIFCNATGIMQGGKISGCDNDKV